MPLHLVTEVTDGSHLHLVVWRRLPLGMFNLPTQLLMSLDRQRNEGYMLSMGTYSAFQPRCLIVRYDLLCGVASTVEPEMGTWLKRGCAAGWWYIGFACWPANQPSALEWLSGMSSASLTYTLRLVRVLQRCVDCSRRDATRGQFRIQMASQKAVVIFCADFFLSARVLIYFQASELCIS